MKNGSLTLGALLAATSMVGGSLFFDARERVDYHPLPSMTDEERKAKAQAKRDRKKQQRLAQKA